MMVKQKNSPGRPKKQFVSKKPKALPQAGPGRPKKNANHSSTTEKLSPKIVGFVAKSVDNSKKKDLIIFFLFLLSFMLFLSSIYVTFIKNKKTNELLPSGISELSEITNIETGNIEYTSSILSGEESEVQTTPDTTSTQVDTQNLSLQQQTIINFYTAVNAIDTQTMYSLVDTPLTQSNVFKTYYSKNWLSKFFQTITQPKIAISNIREEQTSSVNPKVKKYSYTVEYVVASNNQKYTEERSTLLIQKNEIWKIGKLMCEIKGCSTMPFFNPDKYKNN